MMDDILRSGEKIYLEKLKKKLESENLGAYVVIDTTTEKYKVSESKLKALEEAKKEFGNKLFYTVKIGSLDKSTINYRSKGGYAWNF